MGSHSQNNLVQFGDPFCKKSTYRPSSQTIFHYTNPFLWRPSKRRHIRLCGTHGNGAADPGRCGTVDAAMNCPFPRQHHCQSPPYPPDRRHGEEMLAVPQDKNDHEASGSWSGKKPWVGRYVRIEFARRLSEENCPVPWSDANLPEGGWYLNSSNVPVPP
jgi:hypothetical protein